MRDLLGDECDAESIAGMVTDEIARSKGNHRDTENTEVL
jgi:hypothetical protein